MRRIMLIALLAACSASFSLWTEAAETKAPKFEVVTLGGEVFSTDSLRGQPTLLIFWAPWCKVCQKELPVVADFYAKERPAQLRVVSIGFADTRGHVEEFVKNRPSTFIFPTAYDIDNDVAQEFKVTATPTYVLLSPQGTIALVHRGAGLLQDVRFREFVSRFKAS